MKLFIKRYWIFLISILCVAIGCLALVLIKTNYEVTTPASITKVDSFITLGDNYDYDIDESLSLDINTVSVYSYSRISLLSYLFAKINNYAKINEVYQYEDTSNNYIMAQGTLDKRISIYNSVIAAYEAAGYNIGKTFSGYIITTIRTFCTSDVQIGDIIESINGKTMTTSLTPSMVIKECYESDVDKVYSYPTVIKRGEERKNITLNLVPFDETLAIGISFDSYYYPYVDEAHQAPSFKYLMGDSIGPSGGLMQALYIYELLNGGKLTKNLKIAGTGTIDINGNAGLIGGIEQKIYTAELSKVDIFFVPVDMSYTDVEYQNNNWNDALKAYETLKNPHMKIVAVKSLSEVITYLEGLQDE